MGGAAACRRSVSSRATGRAMNSLAPSTANAPVITVCTTIPTLATIDPATCGLPIAVLFDPAVDDLELSKQAFNPEALAPATLAALLEAEVLLTEPSVRGTFLGRFPDGLPKLKWAQSTYAGVDAIFNSPWFAALEDGGLPSWRLSRFAGKFGPPIAEWVIGMIIARERKFKLMAADQLQHEWAGHTEVADYRQLSELTVGIIGKLAATPETAFDRSQCSYRQTAIEIQ